MLKARAQAAAQHSMDELRREAARLAFDVLGTDLAPERVTTWPTIRANSVAHMTHWATFAEDGLVFGVRRVDDNPATLRLVGHGVEVDEHPAKYGAPEIRSLADLGLEVAGVQHTP